VADPIEQEDEVVHPSLTFEVRGDKLYVRAKWGEDVDFEVFSRVIPKIQQGEFHESVLGAIRNFGRAVEDEDFAETLGDSVDQQMRPFLRKNGPVIRPQAAIPNLMRRGGVSD
jgi:hypothetical protein